METQHQAAHTIAAMKAAEEDLRRGRRLREMLGMLGRGGLARAAACDDVNPHRSDRVTMLQMC